MPAGSAAILLPVFVQVLLTLALMLIMGNRRFRAVSEGAVEIRDVAVSSQAWPDTVKLAANSYANQFELPVLFYAVVGFALITNQVSFGMILLAWVFVLLRILHAGIHITSNNVRWRLGFFSAGAAVLLALWAILAIRIFNAGF